MNADARLSRWLVIPHRNPHASLRLFCLPYAGGNASTYANWSKHLPSGVELVALQPPGRADRILEPAHTRMNALVTDLYQAIQSFINIPYVLMGHSLGSRVAFELAREIRRRGDRLPVHFIASGSSSPDKYPRGQMIHDLPREKFLARISDFNGTPEIVLQHDELMELCLPALRADFELSETSSHVVEPPLDCPLSIFSGSDDRYISEGDLTAWRDHFTRGGEVTLFPEDHFFVEKLASDVIRRVTDLLCGVLDDLATTDANRVAV